MAKRGVSQLCLDPKDVEAAGGQTVRQLIVIKQGIEIETAKKMVKAIKDAKLKVQASDPGGRAAGYRGRTATSCSRPSPSCAKATTGSTCSS